MKTFNYVNFELYIKWFNEHELRASFVRSFLRVTFFPYVIFSRQLVTHLYTKGKEFLINL